MEHQKKEDLSGYLLGGIYGGGNVIIPEKMIKNKNLDYLSGMASGVRVAINIIEDSQKEGRNFMDSLDDAWDEILTAQDNVMDEIEESISKHREERVDEEDKRVGED